MEQVKLLCDYFVAMLMQIFFIKAYIGKLFKMINQLIVIHRVNPNPVKAHIPNFN